MKYLIADYELEGFENSSLSELKKWIKDKKHVALDTETRRYGNSPLKFDIHDTQLVSVQIGDKWNQWFIDPYLIEDLSFLDKKTIIAHNCLPRETEVLTIAGWKPIEEITLNDTVFGVTQDLSIHSQKVQHLIKNKDIIWNLYDSRKSLKSTPTHRWLSKTKSGKIAYQTTEELYKSRSKIILNGHYEKNTSEISLSDEELSLFVWAVTDGHIKYKNNKIVGISITQSSVKNKYVDEIRNLIKILNLNNNEYEVKQEKYASCTRFTVWQEDSRKLLTKINYNKNFNFCEFVLKLSDHQLNIFIDTFNKAEGYTKKDIGRYQIGQSKRINPTKRDAIALALYLKGYTIATTPDTIQSRKSKIADCRTLKRKIELQQDVFCLTTELSNFIVRQNEEIFITGNCKYDYQVLKLEKDYELKRVYDTMLGEYVLNTGLSREKGFYSLEDTYLRYFDENPYGNQLSLFDPWIPKSTRSSIEEITKELAFYGCTDIITTYKVWEAQTERIKEEKLERVMKLENKFVLVLGDMEVNGMPIDVDRWLELDEWAGTRLEEAELKLRELYPEVENWNSSRQVGVLFKKIGIPITNKEGKDSVNELVIAKHAEKFPIIKDYLEYKKFSKLKSTYGIKFLKYVNPLTQRIHSSFLQILNTGRVSSTSPNLQNIISASEDFKEGNWWREAFKVSRGRRLIVADFGSQELRTVADLAKDSVMMDAFQQGKDLHALAASAIYGLPVEKISKEQRREAKIFNFSVLYGAGEDKVSDQFKVSKAKAKQLIANYYATFTGLKKYQETTLTKTLENGYILVDKLGRKSWLPKYEEYRWTKSKRLLAEYSRINSNFPIQGSAASMMKYAAILLRAALVGTTGKIVLLVHDEALVECAKEEAEKIKIIVERCMSTAAKYFCPTVPPPAEAIISNCWNK